MENLNQVTQNLTPQEKQQWAEHRKENIKYEQDKVNMLLSTTIRYKKQLINDILKLDKINHRFTKIQLQKKDIRSLERIFDNY